MKVVIVSRTQMRSRVCIGALGSEDGSNIRLLPTERDRGWFAEAPFQIGEVWDVEFGSVPHMVPPHIEDRVVLAETLVGFQTGLSDWLRSCAKVWTGDGSALFDGALGITRAGGAYIGRDRLAEGSVGFWQPDHDLVLSSLDKERYEASFGGQRLLIPFIGVEEPQARIKAGALVRVSLSRWYQPCDVDGCWLQLSGTYQGR